MAHIVMFSRAVIRPYIKGIAMLQALHQRASNLLSSRHGHKIENVCILSLTAAFAFYSFGRTLVGQCPEGTSMWDKQSCNPLADRHAIPIDMFLVTVIAPLVPQIFLRGARRWAISVSWVICIAFLNASHVVVGAPLDMFAWINMGFLILMAMSYEFERQQLLTFLTKKHNDADIVNQLKASHELERTKLAAIEADMNTKRALVRHIGHELRNPMNTIQGSLEVLQQELKPFQTMLPPDIFDIFTTCRESCSLVRDTVSDLVSFEKIAAGLYNLELSFVSVLKYIDDCTRPAIVEARAKDVTFVLQKDNCVESTAIHIDPLKMAQVFRNLFSNAVKFTRRGGEVVVTISERDAQVRVTVTDQGPGLTKEQIGQLFQEGVQFEANKHQNGYVIALQCRTTPVIEHHSLTASQPLSVAVSQRLFAVD
jgi:signal transduction histidine kinase